MNNDRRSRINQKMLAIASLREELDEILSEEQEYFDNIPENLQESKRAQTSEQAIDILEQAIDSLNNAEELLQEAIE